MRKFIIIGLIASITLQAQGQGHYFNANIGGGFHGLNYTLQNGDIKGGPGGIFNLGYSYFFNPNWGIGTGFGIQSAQLTGTLNFTYATESIDSDEDIFELRVHFNDWEEKQKALFLEIPVGVQYQRWFHAKSGLLAMAGAKMSLPVSSSYEVVSGSITRTGYYEQWNVELSDMPKHGFTTTTERPSGDLAMNTSYSVFADLGWLYKVSDKYDLYAGGYVSYGLNSVSEASASASGYITGETYKSMMTDYQTGKVNVLSVGVKIGLRLHTGKRSKTVVTTVTPVEESIPVDVTGQQPVSMPETEKAPATLTAGQDDVQPGAEEATVQEPVTVVRHEPVVSLRDSIVNAQALADRIKLRFPVNSAVPLNDEFDDIFMELAHILKANPEMKVIIQGHTCMSGREYNLKISKKRAELGKTKFIRQGVPASQIIIECKAFDEPLVPNTNEENRSQNRRIKLIIK